MKNKTMALVNGIVGLAGGILLLIGPFLVLGSFASSISKEAPTSFNTSSQAAAAITRSAQGASGMAAFLSLVGIAILVLGIVGLVHYKGDNRVGSAGGILLIVGGALSIIPFLGWIGGILAIIGGSLYLAKLKNFKVVVEQQ